MAHAQTFLGFISDNQEPHYLYHLLTKIIELKLDKLNIN